MKVLHRNVRLATYPATHDVPEGRRRSVRLDGVLTGVRQGHSVTGVKESRPAESERESESRKQEQRKVIGSEGAG